MSAEDCLQKVREAVSTLFAKSPEAYDKVDIERVDSNSRYVQRFLDHNNGKIDDTVKQLDDTLRWRKSYGVNHMKRSDFPVEFFMAGEVFDYVNDKNNCPTMYCRVELHRAVPEWKETMKRFIVYMMELLQTRSLETGKGMALIFDCRNGSVFNVELDLDYFAIKIMTAYYPRSLEYIIVYDMPIVLWALFKIIQSWLPAYYREKFKFPKINELLETIGPENVPDFLNGSCSQPYNVYNDDCFPYEEYSKLHGYNESDVKKILSKYGTILENASRQCGRTRDGRVIPDANKNQLQ